MVDPEIKDVMYNAGMDLRNAIIRKINSNIPPPNTPSTIKKKKSSKTLVDTGNMITSVDVQVIEETDSSIDVGAGIFDEGVAEYAIANEFGSVRTLTTKNKDNVDEMHQGYSVVVIPERSFIRTAYDESIEEIMAQVNEEIGDIMAKKFKGQ